MSVFFILSVEVGYRVISNFSDKRVRVCRAVEEEFLSETENKVADAL
jgi:nitrogen regulatory protein PII-like uncharacterized protein